MKRGRCIGIAAAVGLAVSAGSGCGPAGSAEPDPLETQAAVRRGDFRRELLLTGELQAVRSLAIKAPETTIFQMRIQFMAEEGSVVHAGDSLLDFDSSALAEQVRDLETRILDAEVQIVTRESELASSLKDLEIELAERRYELGRTELEASVDPDVVSRKEYGERQLAFTRARRELEETEERIELTQRRGSADLDVLRIDRDKLQRDLLVAREGANRLSIRAPADGLVVYERRPGTTLRFQEGDSCWPGQTVMRLPDMTEMQAELSVNEVDAPLLAVGAELAMSVDAFPGRALRGRIEHVPSMAVKRDETSKIAVFKVVASLSETWVGEMKPGMSCLGRMVTEELHDVPLASRAAVEYDGERYRLIGGPAFEPLARNELDYVLSEQDFARLTGAPAGGES